MSRWLVIVATPSLRDVFTHDMLDTKSQRGLLRYAVKIRSYSAANLMLELGLTSNNDGSIQLAVTNGDARMLRLLVGHGIKSRQRMRSSGRIC